MAERHSPVREVMLVFRILLVFAVLCATAPPTGAASPSASEKELKKLEKQLQESRDREKQLGEKASGLGKELETLREEIVAAARSAQDNEELLSALERRVRDLGQKEKDLQAHLGDRESQMATVLSGLERLAIRPPEVLVLQPGHHDDTIRSAILLRAVIPELQKKAGSLRKELAGLSTIRRELSTRRAELATAVNKLDRQHARLATLYARKAKLAESTEAERKAAANRAEQLARNAGDLRDLLAKLEEDRRRREAESKRLARLAMPKPPTPAPGPVPSLESQRGTMALPARGQIVMRYGEETEEGLSARGVTIRTRPGAQVTAPATGTVAFAGPFRGYGLLLIMEHSGGYHVLLSGMSRIDAVVGQSLRSGEPVGIMGPGDGTRLYVELRRDGQPVNPLPWLSARKG
ncbi:murein hydrolase activator EnvC family protein [Haematospirillum jordaniae]|nr:peptidoglycan DD-metalloendopeptidase family protein [Haematospirillum jordaniae]